MPYENMMSARTNALPCTAVTYTFLDIGLLMCRLYMYSLLCFQFQFNAVVVCCRGPLLSQLVDFLYAVANWQHSTLAAACNVTYTYILIDQVKVFTVLEQDYIMTHRY